MEDQMTRVLVVLDDTDGTTRALRYVARLLSGQPHVEVSLLHVLTPLPKALDEFSDVEDPGNDEWITPELDKARKDWNRRAAEDAAPVLQRAQTQLIEAGFDARDVRAECRPCGPNDRVADIVIGYATEERHETIVVGRHVYPWLLDLFHRHLERDLVRRAHHQAVWVIA